MKGLICGVAIALAASGVAWSQAAATPQPTAAGASNELVLVEPAPGPAAVLEQLHAAAARADADAYFRLFLPGAVYIGTDASERWTLGQFRAFAEPYFRSGRGWTYTLRPNTRNVQYSPDHQVAWFDEILDNASYGTTRGTGVLVRTPQGWRIAQYHLTIPMPNALAREFVGRIRESERAAAPAPAPPPPSNADLARRCDPRPCPVRPPRR